MGPDLERLLRPRSIAVIGGGAWCTKVIEGCRRMGYDGVLWAVHPNRAEIAGVPCLRSVSDLPGAPDAAFVGVNRVAAVEVVRALSGRGAGGAVVFASGFREAVAELPDGPALEADLIKAAGAMPFLGPNCYGLMNLLDGAALWPDQHGAAPVDRGVAILSQSSNIALNLTMQRRGLPLAYVATVGNQAVVDLASLGAALLQDYRVTALALHVEGLPSLDRVEALAATAHALGKPVVVLRVGESDQAQSAAVSHTASLTGSAAGARALFRRLGLGQVESLEEMLEALKLLHAVGPLGSDRVASLSCSGGEASLVADRIERSGLTCPPLNETQAVALRAALGPRVALSNPLDYHTYIWGDRAAMARTFAAMMSGDLAIGCVVLDFPREDRCDDAEWPDVIAAMEAAQAESGRPMAVLSSLPEGLPEPWAERILAAGLVPLAGLEAGIAAIDVAARLGAHRPSPPVWAPAAPDQGHVLNEADSKAALAAHGVPIPPGLVARNLSDLAQAAAALPAPLALKGLGIAHKSEAGAVALGLSGSDEVRRAAKAMPTRRFLLESMVPPSVAELLVGVVSDPVHGFVLTLGAGGVMTELLADTATLVLPVTEADVRAALAGLRVAPLLAGFRGRAAADMDAIVAAVLAVQSYVWAERSRLQELDINPLMCGTGGAVAADALIRLSGPSGDR